MFQIELQKYKKKLNIPNNCNIKILIMRNIIYF